MQPDTVYKRGGSSIYPDYPAVAPGVLPGPYVPPLGLFPRRDGPGAQVPTIMSVLSTNRLYSDARGRVSGYVGPGYSGTARPATSWM